MNSLNQIQSELSKVFGRLTKWRILCKEKNATSEEEQIRLANQVIAESKVDADGYVYDPCCQEADVDISDIFQGR